MSIKKATNKQIDYGKILGLNLKSKSFRIASAMIGDEIEERCWKSIKTQELKKGDKVKYIGNYKGRINKIYTINSIGKYGLIYLFIKDKFGNKKSSYAYAFYLKKIQNELISKKLGEV